MLDPRVPRYLCWLANCWVLSSEALINIEIQTSMHLPLLPQGFVALTTNTSSNMGATAQVDVPACEGQAIFVLDLNAFAEELEMPRCSLHALSVEAENGVVYPTGFLAALKNPAPHFAGTHSAPWYLQQVRVYKN